MLTETELKIFACFGQRPDSELTIADLKRLSGQKSNNAVYRSLDRFRKEQLITERKIGNVNVYALDTTCDRAFLYLTLAYHTQLPKQTKKPVHDVLRALDDALLFYCLAVFGSYAKKTYTSASDLDIVVVVQTPKEQELATVLCRSVANKTLLALDVHVMTIDELQDMLLASYETLGKQLKEQHIPLRNAHALYNILHGKPSKTLS